MAWHTMQRGVISRRAVSPSPGRSSGEEYGLVPVDASGGNSKSEEQRELSVKNGNDDKYDKPKRGRVSLALLAYIIFGSIFALYSLTVFRMSCKRRGTARKPAEKPYQLQLSDYTNSIDNQYTLWSREETYVDSCQKTMLHNDTWGRERGRFVDKVGVKHILRRWMEEDEEFKSLGMKIPKTLEVITRSNATAFTLDVLRKLPQPYIIKLSHGSGKVARVFDNNTYWCLKGTGCDKKTKLKIDDNFTHIYDHHIVNSLLKDTWFLKSNREPQYQFIPPSTIIEEDILYGNDKMKKDVTYWYVAGGTALFASQQCLENNPDGRVGVLTKTRKVYSADYTFINMKLTAGICRHTVEKPNSWDRQRRIAEKIGERLPHGVVRLDLYAGDEDVYFSEVTFTSTGCKFPFKPAVADGMLYAVMNGQVPEEVVTPEFVEKVIADTSWSSIEFNQGGMAKHGRTFPSPLDLCEALRARFSRDVKVVRVNMFKSCLESAQNVSHHPVRCIMERKFKEPKYGVTTISKISSFGLNRRPKVRDVLGKLPLRRLSAGLGVLLILFVLRIGDRRKNWKKIAFVNIDIIFLASLLDNQYRGGNWFSGFRAHEIYTRTFKTFKEIHSVDDVGLSMIHFFTYWLYAIPWFARTPRKVLMFCLLTQATVLFIDEWAHHYELRTELRCQRSEYIDTTARASYDNFFREFIWEPIFVYFYLLPKFIHHWIGEALDYTGLAC